MRLSPIALRFVLTATLASSSITLPVIVDIIQWEKGSQVVVGFGDWHRLITGEEVDKNFRQAAKVRMHLWRHPDKNKLLVLSEDVEIVSIGIRLLRKSCSRIS